MTAQEIDIHVFARNPSEMQGAQRAMIHWATNKIAATFRDLSEASENLRVAKAHKWRSSAWQTRVRRLKKRVSFYQKVRSALKAGYYIVPPFPVELFAVRTDGKIPKRNKFLSQYPHSWHLVEGQTPRLLPEGEGRYVSDEATLLRRDVSYSDSDGKRVQQYEYFADEFSEIDFPFKLVKPEVMVETARAMAIKVFDQLGVLPSGARGKDPIVVGQIVPPEPNRDPVTFFVAWWLDTEGL